MALKKYWKKILVVISIVTLLVVGYFFGRWIYAQFDCKVLLSEVSSIEYDGLHGLWGGARVKVFEDGTVEGEYYKGLGGERYTFGGSVQEEDFARLVFLINENNVICIGDTIPKEGLEPDTYTVRYLIDFKNGNKYEAESVGGDGYSSLEEEMIKIGDSFKK